MLKGKAVGCSAGSGGGNSCSVDTAESPSAAAVGAERPRKKLSFREPEIMGYNVQMKQGTPTSTAKRNKVATPVTTMPSTPVISGTSPPARNKNCLEDISGSFEDLDLEVGH